MNLKSLQHGSETNPRFLFGVFPGALRDGGKNGKFEPLFRA